MDADAVNNGGVVPVAENPANLRERQGCVACHEVHRPLRRLGGGAGDG
jgi:cytochrome c551/c552